MTSTVSSRSGRKWLQSHLPAVTVFENNSSRLPDTRDDVDLSDLNSVAPTMENLAETPFKVPKVEKPQSGIENIYHQLHGTDDTLAIEHISDLVIPKTEAASGASEHQIVFVSVPNINATDFTIHVPEPKRATVGTAEEIETSVEEPRTDDSAQYVSTAPTSMPESAVVDPSVEENSSENLSAPNFDAPSDQIDQLVTSILERFPLASPAVLLFVSSEGNPHVDETAARVAAALSSRHIGKILLVDGDVDNRRLTSAGGMIESNGLAECIKRGQRWEEKIIAHNHSSFGFMPAGKCDIAGRNIKQQLIKSVAEMKRDFQFVCVSAGSAHSAHAKLWYDCCDGSYLVVSLKSTNKTVAQSSVNELRAGGARLLGCVVTDVE